MFRHVCADLVRFDKMTALKEELDLDGGFCAQFNIGDKESRLLVNKHVVESGLFKVLDRITGKKADADRCVLERATALCQCAEGVVPEEMCVCLRRATIIFGSEDDGVDGSEQEAVAKQIASDMMDNAYTGFMKVIVQHARWPTIVSMSRAVVATKAKRSSRDNVLREVHASFAKLTSEELFQEAADDGPDAQAFRASFGNLVISRSVIAATH